MREYRYVIIVLLILAIAVTAMEIASTAQRRMSPLDRAMTSFFSPFQKVFSGAGALIGNLFSLGSMQQQKKDLEDQIFLLNREISDLQMERVENLQLRKLLHLEATLHAKTVPADVIQRDPSNWFDFLELDRGTSDDVLPDEGVAGPNGVVGKISDVTEHRAHVALITNPEVALPVEILPGGAEGIAYGSGDGGCIVRYIQRYAPVKPGDRVVTSGLGHVFKEKGMPVGIVLDVNPDPQQVFFKVARVRPFLNEAGLRSVLVLIP